MHERPTQPDCLDAQRPHVVGTQGQQTLSALGVESDALPDTLLSPDENQWWDGSTWQYIHADAPRLQPEAASGRPEYPVTLHWKLGTLPATPVGVAFDMTARSVLFGRHKRNIHRDFAYADLCEVEIHPGRASIGVVLRTREDEIQGCQGCTNADEVDAFVAVLVKHDVDVLVGSATSSVMVGRYSG